MTTVARYTQEIGASSPTSVEVSQLPLLGESEQSAVIGLANPVRALEGPIRALPALESVERVSSEVSPVAEDQDEPTIAHDFLVDLSNTISRTSQYEQRINRFGAEQEAVRETASDHIGQQILAVVRFGEHISQTLDALATTAGEIRGVKTDLIALRTQVEGINTQVTGLDTKMRQQASELYQMTVDALAKIEEYDQQCKERDEFDAYRRENPNDEYAMMNMEWRMSLDSVIWGLEKASGDIGTRKFRKELEYKNTGEAAVSQMTPYEELARTIEAKIALFEQLAPRVASLQQRLANADIVDFVQKTLEKSAPTPLSASDGRSLVNLIYKLTSGQRDTGHHAAIESQAPSPPTTSGIHKLPELRDRTGWGA